MPHLNFASLRRFYIYIFIAALGFCAGCTGKILEDPDRLENSLARIHMRTGGSGAFWKDGSSRVTAVIQPESLVLFSALSVNFTFQSIYRNYPDGSTKFVMFMPQGTRLGSCERRPEGALNCQQLPLPEVSDIVRTSFYAIDNLLAASPCAKDEWRLQYGDRIGGESSDKLVVARQRGGISNGLYAIYAEQGTLLKLYKLDENRLSWKISFYTPSSAESSAVYRYKSKNSNWIYNVNILEVK